SRDGAAYRDAPAGRHRGRGARHRGVPVHAAMNEPGIQSAAHPAGGSGAALIGEFTTVLYVGGFLIFAAVMWLLLVAVFGKARAVDERRWIVGGGLVFPGITLSALLVYSLAVGATLTDANASGPLRFLLNCVSDSARLLF